MAQLQNRNTLIISIAVLVLVSISLFLFQDFRKSSDGKIEKFFIKTRGEIIPDTSVIVIHFSEEDISRIGPWPIKRNYYALLINQLTSLGVKKIGLEIFLSSRLVTQSVYDNLLMKEIEKSGKVVLSSVAGSIVEKNNLFITDSLSYPSPNLLNEKLLTGHINFVKDKVGKMVYYRLEGTSPIAGWLRQALGLVRPDARIRGDAALIGRVQAIPIPLLTRGTLSLDDIRRRRVTRSRGPATGAARGPG